MGLRHNLALDFPDTGSPYVLRISDLSVYVPALPVECPRLDITIPGFSSPVYITDIQPEGNWNLTDSNLGIQSSALSQAALPDGIYTIRYSVAPNAKVFVLYYHLRLTNTMNRLESLYCRMRMPVCSQKDKEALEDMSLLRAYLAGAKADVERCHNLKRGEMLYYHSLRMLQRLSQCHTGDGCTGCF